MSTRILTEKGPSFLDKGENETNFIVQKPVALFQEDIRALLGHEASPTG